jgi:hypothetical protein
VRERERRHIARRWMEATGVPEQNVHVLFDHEFETVWVIDHRGAYWMQAGSDDAAYEFKLKHGTGPVTVCFPLMEV